MDATTGKPQGVEPWLRGTLGDSPAIGRAVLHALELAREDLHHWAGSLTDEQLNCSIGGVAPVAFHLRHIARSLDRLLTYAEGTPLSDAQKEALRGELAEGATSSEIFAEFDAALERSAARVRVLCLGDLEQARYVGGKRLPTSLGGLLVHVADHTQRHVGQAITTAKIVAAS